MSWLKQSCDVLVVGAGPVGLFTALELAHRGASVRIVEEQWRTTSRSYALGLHPRTLEMLDVHGLASGLVAQGNRLDAVVLRDRGGERARLEFAKIGSKYPFELVLPQFGLEQALEEALEKRKVKVEWNHRVAEIRPEGTRTMARVQRLGKDSVGYAAATTEWVVDKEFEIEASYVVGCDGHRSKVRRSAGIPYDAVAESELFAVFEFAADGAPLHEAHVVLDETTDVLWSMRDGRFRWGFQLTDPAAAEDARTKSRLFVGFDANTYPAIDPDRLEGLIRERAPWFTPRVKEIFWSAAIRFERRLADPFGRGHVWLAGDSAHLAGPIGMHSMNVGLREGRDLAHSLARRLKEGPSGDALERYDAARRREWRQLLDLEGGPVATKDADPWVASRVRRILSCAPSSGTALESLLAPLGITLVAEAEWPA